MASLTMSDLSFYEPMRKNWFIVQFDSGFGDDSEALSIACKTCDIPKMTTTDNVIDRINDKVYTPGKSEFSTISMTFYEYIKDDGEGSGSKKKSAGQVLNEWQKAVHNATTGVQGAKKSISHNAAIVQIDGAGEPVRVWNIYNCWPTEVSYANLDSADGGLQDVTLTLRYDWAEQSNTANISLV